MTLPDGGRSAREIARAFFPLIPRILGRGGIVDADVACLLLLCTKPNGVTFRTLRIVFNLPTATATGLVERAVALDLVQKTYARPENTQGLTITLTPKGWRAVKRARGFQ